MLIIPKTVPVLLVNNILVHGCNSYMIAGPKDLWETFDYVLYDADYNIDDDVTIYKYMDSWTNQPGYPLITVTSTSDGFFKASQVMKKINIQN